MTNFFETSFVPQQPITKPDQGGLRRRESVNTALIVALILFFTTIAVAGGMYVWKKNIETKRNTAGLELAAMEKNFDINKIHSYKDLQVTIQDTKTLVDNHMIFSVVLDNIERYAAENIGLTSLAFGTAGNKLLLTLTGQAPSYKAVYFQIETWRGMKPLFKDVEVTSLSLSEGTGIVTFSAMFEVDAHALAFQKYLVPVVPLSVPTPIKSDMNVATTSSITSSIISGSVSTSTKLTASSSPTKK